MAIQKNRNWKVLAFLFLGSISLGAFFQNCSNPNLVIEDLTLESKALEAERIALGKADEEVTVGLQSVPPLKMFFVVDNSGTMRENQLNLAASFGAMFDQSSSDSLSKFDTSSYLISTAQKSLTFKSDRGELDAIFSQQKNFSLSASLLQADLDLYRSSSMNSGAIPGDNIGFHLVKSEGPLRYAYSPAMVLGAEDSGNGSLSWKKEIRKLASESPQKMETEFKKRLSILDAGRIPLEQVSGVYRPEHASIVDSESGLCSVARILRNPDSYIQSGDLLSFVIVSDENDNDPSGASCVQSYSQYTGKEDLYDVNCVQSETSINKQTSSLVKAPDSCALSGLQGYNVSFIYPVTRYQTDVNYKNIVSRAKYGTPRSNVSYKAKVVSFEYPQTDISYYVQTCVDVISDGLVVGKKCSISTSPSTGSKMGDFKNSCFDLAKQLNPNAVDVDGKKPSCVVTSKPIASCDPAQDAKCKKIETQVAREMRDVYGALNASQCLSQAKTDSAFDTTTTPVCTPSSMLVSETPCSLALEAAGCAKISEAQYGVAKTSVNSNLTTTATSCYDWVKANRSDNAVSSVADVSCTTTSSVASTVQNIEILFKESMSLDGGQSLPVGDCGVLKSMAYAKAKVANANLTENDTCNIVGYSKAATTSVAASANKTCQMLADERCVSSGLRTCSSTLNQGATTTVYSGFSLAIKVKERLNCASKCSESKLSACGSDPAVADMTVAQYLQSVYGSTAVCASTTVDLATPVVQKKGVLQADIKNLCAASLEGIPSYPLQAKGPYQTVSDEVDYVAGTIKDPVTGVASPKMNLIDYIRSRSAELSQISPIFASIVRLPTDTNGKGGSAGIDYLKLVEGGSAGQVESVLSKDYSVVLKDLGKILKTKLDRSFVLQKMKAHQIITRVYLQPQGQKEKEIEISEDQWDQSGTTLTLNEKLEYKDGDKFRVEYQNYIKK